MKAWFSINGALEPIAFDGPNYFRFPLELAELVISRYSAPGDWVLDPFCGFGTTLIAAQRLGRQAIRFEKDAGRASFAAGRVTPPSRVINENIRCIGRHDLPPFALLFTSPPYSSFRNESWATDVHYCQIPHDSSQGLVASLHFNSPSASAEAPDLSHGEEAPAVSPVSPCGGRFLMGTGKPHTSAYALVVKVASPGYASVRIPCTALDRPRFPV